MKLAFISILFLTSFAAADSQFFKATPENTRPESNAEFDFSRGEQSPAADKRWHWQEVDGTGFFAGNGAQGNNLPVLITTITGLKSKTDYRVDGFFRGSHADGETRGDIRMGLTLARTEAFGVQSGPGLPGVIGLDDPSKRVSKSEKDELADFPLYRAAIGVARSDALGALIIFIDDHANDKFAAGTYYEGISVSPATDGSEPQAGAGTPQVLVESLRVNDRATMERELAAGADLNTPDRENFTALFYAALTPDHELVARFLKAGADPNCPGQALSPLWAAAHLGDETLVKTLLTAGAEVNFGTTQATPASAAVHSGSVKTVEALLAHQPDLDLEKAVYGPDYKPRANAENLISLAMKLRNFEMATWLIQNGYSLEIKESPSLPFHNLDVPPPGGRSLLVRAIMHEPPLMDIVNALAARGTPMIFPDRVIHDAAVAPWDALSAAAFEGNAELVKRWLPLAKSATMDYRNRLSVLADASASEEVSNLVRIAFPDTKPKTFRWSKAELIADREALAGDISGFVPRAKAALTTSREGDKLRLAVLGNGSAAGPADALGALASNEESIEVVDREELASILVEHSIKATSSASASELNKLGDALKADIIVTAASFGKKADAVLRFEAHDVRTGLTILRTFQPLEKFDPGAFTHEFLAELREKSHSLHVGKPVTAITLLGVIAEDKDFRGATLSPTLQAGLLQEIDATPGLIALTRDQLAPLVAERTFGQEGVLWGAAWTLQGGLREAEKPAEVTLALRLRSVVDESLSHDIFVQGPADDPRALTESAWIQLREKIDLSPPAASDPNHAVKESDRLAREAESLLKTPLAWQAAPLADAALYLGGNRLERLSLRQKSHWAACFVINPRQQWDGRGWTQHASGYPLTPHIHEFYLYWLDEHHELLRLTAATVDEALSIFRQNPGSHNLALYRQLWGEVERLTEYRCYLNPKVMKADQNSSLAEFDRELRDLWGEISSYEPGYRTGSISDGTAARLLAAQRMTKNFRKLPWLGELLAKRLILAAQNPASPEVAPEGTELVTTKTFPSEAFIYPRGDTLATVIEPHISGNDAVSALRRAEVAWLRGNGSSRRNNHQALYSKWAAALATQSAPPSRLLAQLEPAQAFPSFRFGNRFSDTTVFALPLPSVVAAPRDCVDLRYRAAAYQNAFRHFGLATDAGEEWKKAEFYIVARFRRELSNLTKESNPVVDYDLLQVATEETDRYLGTTLAPYFAANIANARPKNPTETFGATNGFSVAMHEGAIKGNLLADLCAEISDKPALITLHVVDPMDRNILWMVVQPLPDGELQIHDRIKTNVVRGDRYQVLQPWLVAVDCREGKVVHRVNLIEAAYGRSAGRTNAAMDISSFVENRVAFNQEEMLLVVKWRVGKQYQNRLVGIRRSDGEVTQNVKVNPIVTNQLALNTAPAIAGLGKDFYYIADDDYDYEKSDYVLWKLSPGKEPEKLSVPGRRPVESPFDSADRKPALLRVDRDKILVASAWDFHAHYDPETGGWADAANQNGKDLQRYIWHLHNKEREILIDPQHRFAIPGADNGEFALREKSEPGLLVYQKSGKYSLRLPLDLSGGLNYPGEFQIRPTGIQTVNESDENFLKRRAETVSMPELLRSSMVRPEIFNQTEDALIVGLYFEIEESSFQNPSFSYQALPYLWEIPKEELRERLIEFDK